MNRLSSLFVRWSSKVGRPVLISLLDEIVEDVGEGAGGGRWRMAMVGWFMNSQLAQRGGVSPCHVDRSEVSTFHASDTRRPLPRACLVITPRSGSFQNDRRVVENGFSGTKSRSVAVNVEHVPSRRDGSTVVSIAERSSAIAASSGDQLYVLPR